MARDGEGLALLAIAPPAIARQKTLHAANEICTGYVKSFRDFKDGCQRGTILPPLQKAYVFRVVPAFESQCFLRDSPLLSQVH